MRLARRSLDAENAFVHFHISGSAISVCLERLHQTVVKASEKVLQVISKLIAIDVDLSSLRVKLWTFMRVDSQSWIMQTFRVDFNFNRST